MNAARLLNMFAFPAILVAFCVQAWLAMPRLSATTDEAVHLAAGYSYWQTRDFRMNPEHPPLAKLLGAVPLLFMHLRFDTKSIEWQGSYEYGFGFNFLYNNDADRLLFWSRMVMAILTGIGLIVTFLWARDLFGPTAGVMAAGMYAFSPNLLGHGILITTDVPLAVFTVLTLYLFWKGGIRPSWWLDGITGLALGAAMATKFSGAFLPLLIVILCIAHNRHSAIKRLVVIGCASLLVIEAAYFFSVSPLLYFKNATLVNANHMQNYRVYLMGRLKPNGWWYYFLAAFAFKATLPTLVAIALAVYTSIKHAGFRWSDGVLLAAIVSYFLLISAAADQIGLRYLLPIFPLIFIWSSRIAPHFASMRGGVVVMITLLAWQACSAIRIFPNHIAYFNELAGGPAAGPVLLDDSNVDWGQGVKEAAEYVQARHLNNVFMYTFSPFDNPQYYGLPANIPIKDAFQHLVAHRPAPGTYIISSHHVARMRAASPDWKMYQPVDRIGASLCVYTF
jgi:Dolichyl-phosphate-mannose-protein mannosyltransferase